MFAKLLLCVLSVVMSAAALAGCAYTSGTAASQNRTHITIMANLHSLEVPSDKIEKLVEEKTGTELDIQWIPDGSNDEKVNAAISTGTLPKALYLKNAASFPLFRDQIRNGLFWEIGSLLDDYPNLSRLKTEVLNNISVNGKLYGLYQERPLSRQGIIYRKDWADTLKLKAPATLDELYVMLKQFTHNDPDRNGKDDTFGLTDRGDLVYGAFKTVSTYFGTPNGWGEQDGKLLPEFMFPEYMETMKFFRKLHQEGLVNRDFPVTGKVDQQALLLNGKAGMYIGAMGDVISLESRLKAAVPEAALDVHNRIKGPKGYGVWANQGYGTVVLFPKSAIHTEAELKDVLAFFDRLMSAEISNLIYWGIEGSHYELKKGKVVPTDNTKLTHKEVKPYQSLLIGGPSTISGMLEPEFPLRAKEKAEALTKDNESMLIHDPTAFLESDTYNEKGVRLQETIKDATYKFMLGLIDEQAFQSEIERWLEQGGSKIIEEYNASYTNAAN
ncbi:extracellular solute-binding protein [Paenibacillus alkalitolerans]|uniref:extracellular solute-binding protein n=1 Tax=Paenibacillus alkalitolerans TaxID=2799335 RepID=UPI0018F46D23|nr:extracellular solute-binding protein [Paenibacillus alkalitolerans]